MKRRSYITIVLALIAILVITGCAPATQEPTTPPTEVPTDIPTEELTEVVDTGRFTIQADESIRSVITTLYSAIFSDELPVFIEQDADLLVRTTPEDEVFSMDAIPATFLPGWQMLPQR